MGCRRLADGFAPAIQCNCVFRGLQIKKYIFQVNNYSYQILSRICIHICMNKNFVCIVFPLPIFLACFTRDMGHALRLQQFAFL